MFVGFTVGWGYQLECGWGHQLENIKQYHDIKALYILYINILYGTKLLLSLEDGVEMAVCHFLAFPSTPPPIPTFPMPRMCTFLQEISTSLTLLRLSLK